MATRASDLGPKDHEFLGDMDRMLADLNEQDDLARIIADLEAPPSQNDLNLYLPGQISGLRNSFRPSS